MASVAGPVPSRTSQPTHNKQATTSRSNPTGQDPFHGHERMARLAARFVSHLFACPDQPAPAAGQQAPARLDHFIAYALHRTCLPESVTYASLFLLQRLKARFSAAKGSSGHRLFISAFMLASKIICDDTYSNKSWCIVAQGHVETCSYLQWQLNVDKDVLADFTARVASDFSYPGPYPALVIQSPTVATSPLGQGGLHSLYILSGPPSLSLVPTRVYCLLDYALLVGVVSRCEPTELSPDVLMRTPTPNVEVVDELVHMLPAMARAGYKSVQPVHLNTTVSRHFPMWLPLYWKAIAEMQPACTAWARTIRKLESARKVWAKDPTRLQLYDVAEDTFNLLDTVRWSDRLCGFSDDTHPLHVVSAFGEPTRWLSTSQENLLLDLLRDDVLASDKRGEIEVENMDFLTKLTTAYKTADIIPYGSSRYVQRQRGLGESLSSGARKAVCMLANVGGNHWVGVVVDFASKKILYGDSMNHDMPELLQNALVWWTAQHSDTSFEIAALETVRQRDGHSCGLLAFNAVGHWCLPSSPRYQLMDAQNMYKARLQVLGQILNRHATNAFDYDMTESSELAPGFEFTFTCSVPIHPPDEIPSSPIPTSPTLPPVVTVDGETDLDVDGWDDDEVDELDDDDEGGTQEAEGMCVDDDGYLSELSNESMPDAGSGQGIDIEPSRFVQNLYEIEKNCAYIMTSIPSPDVQHPEPAAQPSPSAPPQIPFRLPASAKAPKKSNGTAKGLFAFGFHPATAEEIADQRARIDERVREDRAALAARAAAITEEKRDRERRATRERVRRCRERKKQGEIAEGKRDATTGKKRKPHEASMTVDDLRDETRPAKRMKADVAELSRPERRTCQRLKDKRRSNAGRKRKNERKGAVYVNWHSPFLWRQIDQARRKVGWSETAIQRELARRDPELFGCISRTTIQGWIDKSNPLAPRWTDSCLEMNRHGNHQAEGNKGGRRGILASYPDVVAAINKRLVGLRKDGAPISLVSARGVVVATILHMAPEIFEKTFADGSKFRASDKFLRSYLHNELTWSPRHATHAAQKLPADWEEQCNRARLRLAHCIKEWDVPPELVLNTDQTQGVFTQGTKLTWAPTGTRQVAVVGTEEKRAFTAVVTVASSGELLPFQAVYAGSQENVVLPKPTSPCFAEAEKIGIKFVPSKTSTYWSTHETMHRLVDEQIAPYRERVIQEQALPTDQKLIWLIDVWSVHRSKEFRDWMQEHHPEIIVLYVPGGCTGVFQPCDVGIQRLLKHIWKCVFHEQVVAESLRQMDNGEPVKLATAIAAMRNRTVAWLVSAYEGLNKPEHQETTPPFISPRRIFSRGTASKALNRPQRALKPKRRFIRHSAMSQIGSDVETNDLHARVARRPEIVTCATRHPAAPTRPEFNFNRHHLPSLLRPPVPPRRGPAAPSRPRLLPHAGDPADAEKATLGHTRSGQALRIGGLQPCCRGPARARLLIPRRLPSSCVKQAPRPQAPARAGYTRANSAFPRRARDVAAERVFGLSLVSLRAGVDCTPLQDNRHVCLQLLMGLVYCSLRRPRIRVVICWCLACGRRDVGGLVV
ncbi:unnamed protein product [Peniophora sp. CBMAI 1063]|nr:unnamed protein product [Peniophora sp. CBMAI 1063]